MKSKAVPVLCRFGLAAALLTAPPFAADLASGQESKSAAPSAGEKSHNSENKRLMADMQRLADTVRVTKGQGDESKEVKRLPEPLLRFSDQKRFISDGTLWVWGIAGRPLLIAEFHTGDRLKPHWGQWLQATSDEPLAAVIGGHGRWSTRQTDFKLLSIADLGDPAKTEAGRLRQMKRFARTLTASSQWKGQRFELRLLPTEVHRYADAANGLVDGAVFVFTVDNNPEAILFVEAHKAGTDSTAPGSWKYALARMSAASLTFSRGDTEVWAVPESFGSTNETHYAFTRTVPYAAEGRELDSPGRRPGKVPSLED